MCLHVDNRSNHISKKSHAKNIKACVWTSFTSVSSKGGGSVQVLMAQWSDCSPCESRAAGAEPLCKSPDLFPSHLFDKQQQQQERRRRRSFVYMQKSPARRDALKITQQQQQRRLSCHARSVTLDRPSGDPCLPAGPLVTPRMSQRQQCL